MRQLVDRVFEVGAIDWDAVLFDKLIPLPNGTSYNSYLIEGSAKTALLDTVDPSKKDVLVENLKSRPVERLDYLIAHHAEQDHSGSIPVILNRYPEAKLVTNPKCRAMLQDMMAIDDEKFLEIEDGEELSLGDKTLRFLYLPWVHWPETMSSYLVEDKILFSCDFFGSHVATNKLFVDDEAMALDGAKRYYAEIMMPFRNQIRKNIEKLSGIEIEMIAPSHGQVYDKPSLIVDAYSEWISDEVKNEVLLAYVSMHGSTEKMVGMLVEALTQRGIKVRLFELTEMDLGKLAIALVDSATLIIATPAVLAGAHPAAASLAYLVNELRPKTKLAGIINSFGWGSKAVENLTDMMSNLKAEWLEPVKVKGCPVDDDKAKLEAMAEAIAFNGRQEALGKRQ